MIRKTIAIKNNPYIKDKTVGMHHQLGSQSLNHLKPTRTRHNYNLERLRKSHTLFCVESKKLQDNVKEKLSNYNPTQTYFHTWVKDLSQYVKSSRKVCLFSDKNT